MIWLGEPFDFSAGSILNFNKPKGKTSFYVVKRVRSLTKAKTGHAGTLDPFATGVLIVCTGKATKKIQQLMELPKTYVGEVRLGISTDTDDVTGKIISESRVPDLSLDDLQFLTREFVGEIEQIPPMFSAKKVKGRRLYKLARKGIEVERKPHKVTIYDLEVLDYKAPIMKIKVNCSRGTYIRALARDIGEKLKCGAHLLSLIRTKIGNFDIESSLTLNDFEQIIKEKRI